MRSVDTKFTPPKTVTPLRRLRRVSQALFLFLFLYFLMRISYSGRAIDLAAPELVTTTPLTVFFAFDPLVTLGHLLSTHTAYPGFALSLLLAAGTVIAGRFFCGWVCPFGTLHHLCSRLRRGRKGIKTRVRRGRYARPQKLKYLILIFLLVTSSLAFLQVGILDPLCLLARSFSLFVFPAAHFTARTALDIAADSRLPSLSAAAGRIYDFLEAREIIGATVRFEWALPTGLILAALLAANLLYTRFWCRFLCPLGALLGLLSRFSFVRMRKRDERCTWCGKCMLLCQGGSSPEGRAKWKKRECHLCLNCEAECPEDVMDFGFSGGDDAAERGPDLTRRELVTAVGAGLAAVPLLMLERRRVHRARLIRPPGALAEEAFLSACLRCGSCSRICPTAAIQPSLLEAGIEGIWTPRIVPRIGYCIYSCTLCGQVCPSGAIGRLTPEEKTGSGRRSPVTIGTAVVNRERCLAWGMGIRCGACQEVCPVSPKAITLERGESRDPEGGASSIGMPVVNSLLCVGCGRCENICPVEGRAAIRVFSAGESRAET